MPKHATPVKHENGFTINGCTFHVDKKYDPIDAIGQGSYGVVCSVLNTATKEKVAIKKITPMAGDEWDATHTLREIRLMRCLGEHENIISLKDLTMCVEKDELYMMMELADTDLHRLIQSSCPLTEGHIRVIMYQLLSGVKAMHDNGVLHRDLKPGNLLINKDCELKAINIFSSPVDMWSVGCILGELVARKPLFPGSDFMDQLTRVFKVIEIPPKHKRGYTIEKDALKFLSSLPATPPNALDKLCKGKNFSPETKDLLERLLCFNPKERITVDEALRHPFFKGVDVEWGIIQPLKLTHSLEFAFEDQSLPLETLRQFIKDEVAAFQAKTELPPATVESSAVPETNCSSASNSPVSATSADGDYAPGLGFTIKGCEFNVPPKYKAIHVLGEGSYGVVCSATDTELQETVAIKKITPMAGDEWDAKHTLREIRLMRYFEDHPNIASLQNLSTCIAKDELYIMMGLVDTDLHRLIQSKTKLEENHIAAIMFQLLCGAKALHENGVLHRDLKPGNILISKNCDVKITDFGLSRYVPHGRMASQAVHPLDKEAPQLMTEYVVTRWYRPPEIMLAPNGTYADGKFFPVDMWSIGCIFAELLNRKPLFPGTDFIDQLTRVFSLLPVPPKDKRGYSVEGDALKFLESLPKCSPQALSKAFRKASPEAVSLLRRLLCVNPTRRITAEQALQHPYFKTVRAQLGEPIDFHVATTFDFEFDETEMSLETLRALIQDEVRHFVAKDTVKEEEVRPTSKPSVESNHDSLKPPQEDVSGNHDEVVAESTKEESEPETTSKMTPDPLQEHRWADDVKPSNEVFVAVEPTDADDDSEDDRIIVEREAKKATASLESRAPTSSDWEDEGRDELLEAIQRMNHLGNDHVGSHVRPASNQDQHHDEEDPDDSSRLLTARQQSNESIPLPPGWEERFNKKYNRVYYVDHATKTSTWEHPGEKVMARKDALPAPAPVAIKQPKKTPAAVVLPKNWERRTDSKTGRLYYVNLLTKKTFARLPSSVSSSMIHKKTDSETVKKRGVTVPQSPQFSQMSWQRKQRANHHD
ncbi:unnamed protein product [Aphanomyces euteiches]